MKYTLQILLGAVLTAIFTVPALAVSNPSMGDDNIVTLVVGLMAAAAVGLVVMLLLTRNKK